MGRGGKRDVKGRDKKRMKEGIMREGEMGVRRQEGYETKLI